MNISENEDDLDIDRRIHFWKIIPIIKLQQHVIKEDHT